MRISYHLPKPEPVIRAAMKVGKVWVDELDCSKSFSRQPTKKTVKEILQMCLNSNNTFWVFIERDFPKQYFDVGCCTMTTPDYFLWIEIPYEDGVKLIKRYKLKSK